MGMSHLFHTYPVPIDRIPCNFRGCPHLTSVSTVVWRDATYATIFIPTPFCMDIQQINFFRLLTYETKTALLVFSSVALFGQILWGLPYILPVSLKFFKGLLTLPLVIGCLLGLGCWWLNYSATFCWLCLSTNRMTSLCLSEVRHISSL